jgi:hypothetical protein
MPLPRKQKLIQKKTKQTKRFLKTPVAAEVTRLIHQENWSLLTSAATVLKWLQRLEITFFAAFGSTPCRCVFLRSIFPGPDGLERLRRDGAQTQWLFLPEPDTRKTRLTWAAKQARTPVKFKP